MVVISPAFIAFVVMKKWGVEYLFDIQEVSSGSAPKFLRVILSLNSKLNIKVSHLD
jgi:hypothetical protein